MPTSPLVQNSILMAITFFGLCAYSRYITYENLSDSMMQQQATLALHSHRSGPRDLNLVRRRMRTSVAASWLLPTEAQDKRGVGLLLFACALNASSCTHRRTRARARLCVRRRTTCNTSLSTLQRT